MSETFNPAKHLGRRKQSAGTHPRGVTIPRFLRLCFGILIFISIVWPRYLYLPTPFGVAANAYTIGTLIALLVAIGLLAFQASLYRAWINGVKSCSWLVFLFSAFWLWQCISDTFGEDYHFSVMQTARDFFYLASYFLISSIFFLDVRCRTIAVTAFLVGTATISIIGVVERVRGISIAQSLQVYNLGAGDFRALSQIATTSMRQGTTRIQSVFSHPIMFGQYAGAVFPLVANAVSRKGRGILALVTLLLLPVDMFLSDTRSCVFVVMTSLSLFMISLVFSRGRLTLEKMLLSVGVCIIVGGALVSLSGDITALISGRTVGEINSSATRVAEFQNGMNVIAQSPIFGFGDGRSPFKTGITNGYGNPVIDNTYLSVLLDSGGVGLVLWGAFCGTILLVGMRATTIPTDRRDALVACGFVGLCGGIIVGQGVQSIFDSLSYLYLSAGYFVAVSSVQPIGRKISLNKSIA